MLVPFFYAFTTSMLKGALVTLTSWKVEGSQNVPASGPVIVVSNHLSVVDPPLIAASMSRRIVFMAKEELFQSRMWSWSYRGYGAFPVKRGGPDRKALHQADAILKQGMALGVFPEGRRSRTAQMNSASEGVSLIALRSGAPILPVAITGSEKLRGAELLWSRPCVTVRIGEPFVLSTEECRVTKASMAAATDTIMKRIAEMLPESYRGAYGERLAGAAP